MHTITYAVRQFIKVWYKEKGEGIDKNRDAGDQRRMSASSERRLPNSTSLLLNIGSSSYGCAKGTGHGRRKIL